VYVSGIAIGQWNQICKRREGKRRTIYKIARAISLGTVSHVFNSNDYIVRYHDINLLVDRTGCVMVVWRDRSRPLVKIDEKIKAIFDAFYSYREALGMANEIHKEIQDEIRRVRAEQRGESVA